MTLKCVLAAFAIAAGLAAPASALTITAIDGEWENAVSDGADPITGQGTSDIRWGTSIGEGQSGYDFDATATSFDVDADTQFVLGTFTHLNFPVTGSALATADLVVNFTISGLSSVLTSVFSFTHNETDNHWTGNLVPDSSATCADGGQNGTGINVNGCADLVTATSNAPSQNMFQIGGVTYMLEVLGFQYQGNLLTDFWTVERQTNTAQLLAVFRTVDDPQPPISDVPLPASGLLLMAGLAGLFARRRFS